MLVDVSSNSFDKFNLIDLQDYKIPKTEQMPV